MRAIFFFPCILAASACGSDDDTAVVIEDCGDPCTLTDGQNFTYSSAMSAKVVEARAGSDITVEWSALTTDILGHSLDPETDISQVRLVFFPDLEPQEVLDGLSSDALDQSEVGGYFTCQPDSSSCQLATFGLLGATPGVDQYFTEDSGTWFFALGTDGVTGVRSLVFGLPINDSDNLTIALDNSTASLDFDVDLQSAAAIGVPAGTTPTLDWSGLTVDGLGTALEIDKIDLVQVAHYDTDLAAMEDAFFDLPTLAEETWSLDVDGLNSASLADLTGEVPFTGIDASGTWELALWCSSCENPVPKVLAHLAVPTEVTSE